MAVAFSIPQLPQRSPRRRSAVVASLLAVGGAVLSTATLFGMGPSRHLFDPASAAATEMLPFVCLPVTAGSENRRSDSLVAMAAKKAPAKSGGDPRKSPWGQEEEEEKPEPVDEEAELQAQLNFVEKKFGKWKKMKGKFMPFGPKPWDPPRFMKACIQVKLDAKQAANTKIMNQVLEELRRISGVHPKVHKARKNVASFGWRIGYPCGAGVTMYGQLMFDFMNRFNTVTLPRTRDFEGLIPNSFDPSGNFWMGFENQEPFKELDDMIDERELVHGFHVGIVNNRFSQPEGLQMMKDFGFPFGEPRQRFKKIKRTNFATRRGDRRLI